MDADVDDADDGVSTTYSWPFRGLLGAAGRLSGISFEASAAPSDHSTIRQVEPKW